MSNKAGDPTVAHLVELAISRLESLATLPCVAAAAIHQLFHSQQSPSQLADIIESDPAIAAKVLSLIAQQGVNLDEENFPIRATIERLPVSAVREAILSVKTYPPFGQDVDKTVLRKQFLQHCIAVGCCAKDISELFYPEINPQLAYYAGLLHDIGALAVDQAMPRSFSSIVEQAKSEKATLRSIEHKHLGTDHTIIGKRLAQKWQMPEQITLAIWLHHSDTATISQSMPEAKIAQVVRLADAIARHYNIGQSGNYDTPDSPEEIAKSLSTNTVQLKQIAQNAAEQVEHKAGLLGLELPDGSSKYGETMQTAAAQLAREATKLSCEIRELQTTSSSFEFITEFLSSIAASDTAISIAENLAAIWQRFYQTGPVCVYLTVAGEPQILKAVVIESPSQRKSVPLTAPSELPVAMCPTAKGFAVLDAEQCADWLFEQIDVKFEPSRTKLIPLSCGGKTIGAIVFELRQPAETKQLQESLKSAALTVGIILAIAHAKEQQQHFAEQFVQLVTTARASRPQLQPPVGAEAEPQPKPDISLEALAEMAAGAAHELNNPLSVISGIAQLLAETETDPKKRQLLKQVQENTTEISQIIDELMSFAAPPAPRPKQTNIRQILDEAIELTKQKHNLERLDVQIETNKAVENVFADSAQMASAIANILCNSLESYPEQVGAIRITTNGDQSGDFVRVRIIDFGCGMDRETLQKAVMPFFSAKPAGRRRGMGLARAARLIQLNNGSVNITSQPGVGTTVTISLPRK
jgi:putative nucleotidyltransferase with HDIG domain